jgi:hypothetical protein
MPIFTVDVKITKEQVIEFGLLTGDNGPVHSVDGVVQGGFIISMLPKWLTLTADGQNFIKGPKQAVSVMLDTKFRNKLIADTPVTVTFKCNNPGSQISKIAWSLHDNHTEYCSGNWIIHKSVMKFDLID